MTGRLSFDHMLCVTLLVSLIESRKPVEWNYPLQLHKTLVLGVFPAVWALIQCHVPMTTNARWSVVEPFNMYNFFFLWRSCFPVQNYWSLTRYKRFIIFTKPLFCFVARWFLRCWFSYGYLINKGSKGWFDFDSVSHNLLTTGFVFERSLLCSPRLA